VPVAADQGGMEIGDILLLGFKPSRCDQ